MRIILLHVNKYFVQLTYIVWLFQESSIPFMLWTWFVRRQQMRYICEAEDSLCIRALSENMFKNMAALRLRMDLIPTVWTVSLEAVTLLTLSGILQEGQSFKANPGVKTLQYNPTNGHIFFLLASYSWDWLYRDVLRTKEMEHVRWCAIAGKAFLQGLLSLPISSNSLSVLPSDACKPTLASFRHTQNWG